MTYQILSGTGIARGNLKARRKRRKKRRRDVGEKRNDELDLGENNGFGKRCGNRAEERSNLSREGVYASDTQGRMVFETFLWARGSTLFPFTYRPIRFLELLNCSPGESLLILHGYRDLVRTLHFCCILVV